MWRLTGTQGRCEGRLLALSVDEVAEGERARGGPLCV